MVRDPQGAVTRAATVVLGGHWLDRASELAFVTRSIAGAATRCGPVSVLVPGEPDRREPDGAFDLEGMGMPGALRWPDDLDRDATVIVDDLSPAVAALLARTEPGAVLFLAGPGNELLPAGRRVDLVGGDEPLGVHVPVNRLAERHRHHGFGFTGYLLVLSDRTGSQGEPPPAADWLGSAFQDADVVVVEDAVAWAWKGRTLRGSVSVDTRMDLWRLLAHANVCVDLAPGPHIARECIEALRFGTPIIVPQGSGPGAEHARSGGGATFLDESELLEAAATYLSDAVRAQASASARRYADRLYGDPAALVRRLGDLLGQDGQEGQVR
jgi:hypothetical protein